MSTNEWIMAMAIGFTALFTLVVFFITKDLRAYEINLEKTSKEFNKQMEGK